MNLTANLESDDRPCQAEQDRVSAVISSNAAIKSIASGCVERQQARIAAKAASADIPKTVTVTLCTANETAEFCAIGDEVTITVRSRGNAFGSKQTVSLKAGQIEYRRLLRFGWTTW